MLQYLSLKGNFLNDDFIHQNSKAFSDNLTLKALNMSENLITDIGASELFRIIPLNIALMFLSLKRNFISGDSFAGLVELVTGRPITGDDDAAMKSMAKTVVDRNKSLKDLNKKRKKSGFPDILEIVLPADRVAKVGGEQVLLNRSFSSFDFSGNPITRRNFDFLINSLAGKSQVVKDACLQASSTSFIYFGLDDELAAAMASAEQYNLKFATNAASSGAGETPMKDHATVSNEDH